MKPQQNPPLRVLDFDLETIAAGFADPEWVPQKITCAAWSWVDEDKVHYRICGPSGICGRPESRREMLEPLLAAIGEASRVTGHNLLRFDLKVLNAECMRLRLPTLGPLLVEDTMRIPRAKGFKKGQDNLGRTLRVRTEKQAMDWAEWQESYDEPGWPKVISRCVSDVQMHKEVRVKMIDRGWLKPPVVWKP